MEAVMKARTIILSILVIFLVIIAGLYVKNREQESKVNSRIQSVAEEEVENRIQEYINEWEGKTIPTLNVMDLSGREVSIPAKNGKYTVYVVWASWCPDCQRELSILNKLYDEYLDKVNFISISLVGFRDETIDSASNYYNKEGFKFPILFDMNKRVFSSLDIKAIPTVYLVNKDGVIEKVIVESVGEAEFSSILKAAS